MVNQTDRPIILRSPITIIIWGALASSTLYCLMLSLWPLAFVSAATFILSLTPLAIASRMNIELPVPYLAASTIFIFAAVFLGEALDFYERLWWWDIVLHASAAIGFGIVGFLFAFMLFEGDRYRAPSSAVAMISFCFAITVGVIWEFFEFAVDFTFGLNMQKSGLNDTMGDLSVNAIGAFIAALFGYFYLRGRVDGIISHLIEQFVERNRNLYQKYRTRLRRP